MRNFGSSNRTLELLAEQINRSFGPMQDVLLRFQQPVLKMQLQLQQLLGPLQVFQQTIGRLHGPLHQWQRSILPLLLDFEAVFRELPQQYADALIELAERSWYFDETLSLPQLFELHEQLSNGRTEEVDEYLLAHFQSRLDSIRDELCAAFPLRSKPLKEGFAAHIGCNYHLSILALLTQADGICKDLIGERVYSTNHKNRKPRTAKFVESMSSDPIRAAALAPLATSLPLCQSNSSDVSISRHLILHGESIDYGTEINSLKAVSWINYVFQQLQKRSDELEGSELTQEGQAQ